MVVGVSCGFFDYSLACEVEQVCICVCVPPRTPPSLMRQETSAACVGKGGKGEWLFALGAAGLVQANGAERLCSQARRNSKVAPLYAVQANNTRKEGRKETGSRC